MSKGKVAEKTHTTTDIPEKVNLELYGAQVPKGTIRINGAKNSAMKLMAASLVTTERIHLDNFPTRLVDVGVIVEFLRNIGVEVSLDHEKDSIELIARQISEKRLDSYYYPVRSTYLFAAGQLSRNGLAFLPYPGGCKIGARKYDLHVMIWERLGCIVEEKAEYIEIRAKKLRPKEIIFPFSTVGGTENAILCASVIKGTTVIKNAYITPEIFDLIRLLGQMGASIEVLGNSKIVVTGSDSLIGSSYAVIPDRIEALTWIIYSVLSRGDVIIESVPFSTMEVPFIHLKEAGLDLFKNSNDVYVNPKCLKNQIIQPFELSCGTYPGIVSDMQPFYVLLALKADGISRIIDYRYPERTKYLEELSKLCPGAIEWSSGVINVKGPAQLKGAILESTDLRGSMAALIGGLLAEGKSTIRNPSMVFRGYNDLLTKLSKLGIQYRVI